MLLLLSPGTGTALATYFLKSLANIFEPHSSREGVRFQALISSGAFALSFFYFRLYYFHFSLPFFYISFSLPLTQIFLLEAMIKLIL